MANVSRGYSFSSTETVTSAKLATLVDGASVSNIVNADCSATMALVDTKLATISTAGKVNAAALVALADIPNTAGAIPPVNQTYTVVIKAMDDTTALTTGDGKVYFTVPAEMNGMDLKAAYCHVYTASSSGTPTIQLRNVTDAQDMLSTRMTIDANETDSSTAAAAAVINASYDDVATADVIAIDCDVAGTGTKGLEVRLKFSK